MVNQNNENVVRGQWELIENKKTTQSPGKRKWPRHALF